MGLILGLSLGLGIPALIIVVGGFLYHSGKSKRSEFIIDDRGDELIGMNPKGIVSGGEEDLTRHIF